MSATIFSGLPAEYRPTGHNGSRGTKTVKPYNTQSTLMAIIMLISMAGYGQVGINSDGSLPAPSAMLDVVSSDKGILVPRMSILQRKSIIAPATGLLVFQTDDEAGFWYFGSDWTRLSTLEGSGTGSFLARWTLSGTLGNSILYDNGSRIGIGTASPAASALLDLTSTTRGFLPPRMTTAQRDQIASPAAGLTIFNTTVNGNETFDGTTWVGNTHYVGENYGGGIVFYIYDHGRRGLIASTADQSTGAKWSNGGVDETGTTGDGITAGIMNTALIIAPELLVNPNSFFAAKTCADYEVTVDGITYGDWYLPSSSELDLLYAQRSVVGGFALVGNYWSSTENSAGFAWYQNFQTGSRSFQQKITPARVRAIRAF